MHNHLKIIGGINIFNKIIYLLYYACLEKIMIFNFDLHLYMYTLNSLLLLLNKIFFDQQADIYTNS